ncbi:MAG: hypothetical protein HY318_15485 [Armatimonadetes bacterium]|nr:hypothetical protein [Armatimonadota bacterium]
MIQIGTKRLLTCLFMPVSILFSGMLTVAQEADHAQIMEGLRKAEEHVGVWQRYPMIGIPLVQTPPKVDGAVDTREWFAAARIRGLLDYYKGLVTRDSTDVYLCYTNTHLYIAFQVERPENARIPTDRDLFEILIDAWHQHQKYYNIGAGLEKILWDGVGPNVRQDAWNPTWEYKARATEFGWEGEMGVAWKDFGFDAPPPPGTIWGVDFIRNEKTPVDRLAVWSFRGKNWHAVKNLGHLLFTGKPFALRTEGAGWMGSARQGGVKLVLSNFSDQHVTVDVDLELRRTDQPVTMEYYPTIESAMAEDMPAAIGSPLKNEVNSALKNYSLMKDRKEKVTVAPNSSKMVQLVEPDNAGNYLALYSIKEGDRLLSAAALPFQISVPLAIKLESYLLSAQTLAYMVDLRRVADKTTEGSTLLVSAKGPEGKVAAEEKTPAIHGKQEVASVLKFKPQLDSSYIVTASIVEGDKIVAKNEEPIRVPPKPVWLGNVLGKKKFVPEPWTPVKASTTGCQTLTSRFTWSKTSLLPSFKVLGKEILAAPPVLSFKDKEGKELPISVTRFRVKDQDAERVVYDFAARLGNQAEVSGDIAIEFDGLVWYRMNLTPRSSVELSSCSLQFTLRKEFARLCTAGANVYSGAIPKEGKDFPFVFMVWVGGLEGGLQWVAENNRNWFNQDVKKAIRVASDGKTGSLTVNLIDRPVTVSKPVDWSFGFIPTPSRVKPKDWGKYAFFQTAGIVTEPKGPPDESLKATDPNTHWKRTMAWQYYSGDAWKRDQKLLYAVVFHGYWQELFGYPGTNDPERQRLLKESVKWLHGLGIKVIVYAGWGMNIEAPEWKDYGMEMVRLPLSNTGYGTYRQCPTTLWQDWFVYKMAQMIKEYDIDGIFIDSVTSPIETENYTPGMRWVDDQGNVHGSYPLLASREWLKRLYKLWHGELKPNGVVYNHNSPPAIMAIESFADVRTPSEFAQHHEGSFDREFIDYFLAKNGGEQYGLFIEHTNKDWMGEWAKKKTNQLYALDLPLNAAIKAVNLYSPGNAKGSYDLDAQPMPWIWRANQWIERSTAEYLPWWKNADCLRTSPKDDQVLTALWLQKGRKALVCVSNLFKEPRKIEVALKLEKIGLKTISLGDALTGEPIPSEGGKFTLDVGFERYRLVKVSGAR